MDRKFRHEIEGLRAVAAILVAVYHIWLGNVSGGVDVFFVVSGFLITMSLLNEYERTGKISFIDYILKLAKRLFPLAFTVLFFVIIASVLFLPQILWDQTIKEIIASALYIENWQLARNAVDYLAQHNEASPVQHFWAMSVQGQFYFIWPILLFLSIILAKYIFKKSIRSTFLITLIMVFGISLAYSIYLTAENQPWAYFDTFTRVWEFSIGGIIALIISKVVLRRSLSVFLGWLGLIGLISCGLILQVGSVFPGYAALWPTLCAAFILLAGNQGGKFGVHQLLSSKALVNFGGISYGFYLWHWPILIFYYLLTGNEKVYVLDGCIIIISAIILAYATTNFIEKPYRTKQNFSKVKLVLYSLCFVMPVLLLSVGWYSSIKYLVKPDTAYANITDYPGAQVFLKEDKDKFVSDLKNFAPTPLQVRNDLPVAYYDGCHQKMGIPEMIECEYGATENWDYTIALVGGSHALQWLPSLRNFAEQENIKILNYTKAVCRFTLDEQVEDDCKQWNEDVIERLISKDPDLVVTTADVGDLTPTVPTGYLAMWEVLKENKIDVFAIRDNPWMSFDVPYCVDVNGADSDDCIEEREDVLLSESPWSQLEETPTNVHYTDLNDYICDKDTCNPVEGNVLVYRDDNHISAAYSRTLGPILKERLMPVLEKVNTNPTVKN